MTKTHTLRQLFDDASSTYSYLLWDTQSLEAVIIDPVDAQLDRDMGEIQQHGLKLKYIIETHAHADHITSAGRLMQDTGAQTAAPLARGFTADILHLQDGDTLAFGAQTLKAIHTPGHTAGSTSYVWHTAGQTHAFTGDTLLIGGCGRTDFQSGSAAALYHSITHKLLALPDTAIVWPGHDYKGNTQSTIGQEKRSNARVTEGGVVRTQADFVVLMNGLNLPKPKRLDEAVPANLVLGEVMRVSHAA